MKFKSILAAALIIIAALPTAAAAEFEDTKGHWAEAIIDRLAELKIVNGVSENMFDPDGTITRAEFLRMTMGAFGIEPEPYRAGESLDTSSTDWFRDYMQGAVDRCLIPSQMIDDYDAVIVYTDGKSRAIFHGTFNPNKPITREEMAAITQTAYQYWTNVYTMQGTDYSDNVDFIDLGSVSTWALPYVRLAYAQGFINGMDDGRYRPLATATRAQAAAVINNVLNKI